MKIILIADVKTLGKKGDVKEVAEGYARNFLFPKKLAQAATETAIKNAAAQKEKEMTIDQANAQKMRQIADILKSQEIVLKSKEKGGKLFGSISAKDIAKHLQQSGIELKDENIILKNPIKKIGEYEIEIRLAKDISGKIKLVVKGE
jgi:large subunit ribosomal protein L9